MTTVALGVAGVAAVVLITVLASGAAVLARRGHGAYGALVVVSALAAVAADLAFAAVLSEHLGPPAGRRIAVSLSFVAAIALVLLARRLATDWVELSLDAFLLAASAALIGLTVAAVLLPDIDGIGTDAYSFYLGLAGFSFVQLYQLQRRLPESWRDVGRRLLVGAAARVAGAAGLMLVALGADLPVAAVSVVLAAAYVVSTVAFAGVRHLQPTLTAPTSPTPASTAPYLVVVASGPVVLFGLVTVDRLRHGFFLALYASLAVGLCIRHIRTSNAHKRLLTRLEDGERLYRSLVHDSSDVTLIASPEGRLRYVSPAAERVLGQPAETLLGEPLAEVLAVPPAVLSAATDRVLTTGATETLESRRGGRDAVLESVLSRQDDGVLVNVRDVSEQAELRSQLRALAYTDELTGLANWHRMQEEITAALAAVGGAGTMEGPALLFVDLDRFKSVNDAAGHAAGDAVLREVADRLRAAVPPEAMLARVGGDEFVVLLPASAAGRRELVAHDIARVMSEPCETDHGSFSIGASVGIAPAAGARDADDLLRHADLAMYAAKRDLRPWQAYDPQLHAAAVERAERDRAYSSILDHQNLAVVYQPVVELGTGATIACEALLRRRDADGRLGEPAGLLEFASRSGRMYDLSVWVLRAALDEAVRWSREGTGVPVAVNLSSRDVLHPGLADLIRSELRSRHLPARALSVEITEQVLLDDPTAAMAVCNDLRDLGVIVAIDDFGTGFSSLAYLVDLPIDALKIDQSFIHALTRGGSAGVIVRAIVQMATELGLHVVAEGIETEEQRLLTEAAGVRYGQGYLFAGELEAEPMRGLLSGAGPSAPSVTARPDVPADDGPGGRRVVATDAAAPP